MIFCRSFSVVVHNVALFTALPKCFCIWLPFCASCGVSPSRFTICAVWCSAGKSFSLIFYRSFFGAVHNVALFTALPECFCIWLPFCASCGVSPSRFTICAVWCSAGKSFSLIFYSSFSVAVHNVELFTALRNVFAFCCLLVRLWCFIRTLYRFLSLAPFGIALKSCFH